MNTEEAKLILASLHEAADPGNDPEISQAFELLDSDPELRTWFDQERAFDAAIASKLAQVEPPADLKASLVELLDKNAPAATAAAGKVTWLRPPLLAAAAAIILVPLIAFQLMTGQASAKSFDSFRTEMVEFLESDFKLQHFNSDIAELNAWLKAKEASYPGKLPDCVDCPESIGCKIVEWEGQNVTLVCLRNSTKQTVHCFVVPRSVFEDIPDEELIRRKFTLKDLETCGWTDEKNLYLRMYSGTGWAEKTKKKYQYFASIVHAL